jgi:hypothetical protein
MSNVILQRDIFWTELSELFDFIRDELCPVQKKNPIKWSQFNTCLIRNERKGERGKKERECVCV